MDNLPAQFEVSSLSEPLDLHFACDMPPLFVPLLMLVQLAVIG